MADRDTKVIGYFAYASPEEVACDGEACMIAGSEAAMKRYLSISDPGNIHRQTIKKTRFGEIMKGLKLGGSYSFDEDAYNRFYPLAKQVGMPIEAADFTGSDSEEIKFMTVTPTGPGRKRFSLW